LQNDGEGSVVYAELQTPPAKPPRAAARLAVPDTEYASVVSA